MDSSAGYVKGLCGDCWFVHRNLQWEMCFFPGPAVIAYGYSSLQCWGQNFLKDS